MYTGQTVYVYCLPREPNWSQTICRFYFHQHRKSLTTHKWNYLCVEMIFSLYNKHFEGRMATQTSDIALHWLELLGCVIVLNFSAIMKLYYCVLTLNYVVFTRSRVSMEPVGCCWRNTECNKHKISEKLKFFS